MEGLFTRSRDIDQALHRNITSLRSSEDLFDDLAGGDAAVSALLAATEMRVKDRIPTGIIHRGMHYSTAIGHPFETEPFLASRYGDGTYGVWYGALEMDTTVYETAWHMIRDESGIDGLDEIVTRERAVYRVDCRAILLDITGKQDRFPALIANDYGFTHPLGQRLHREGHPGLLSPSARLAGGINAAIFNTAVLHSPQVLCYLTYRFDPRNLSISVEREPGVIQWHVTFA